MRVVGGNLGGRKLECPVGNDIRPTTDRIKENLFNILSTRIVNSNFLDMFSGCGGIGIEAISRGADEVVFVEVASESVLTLKKNLENLKITEGYRVLHSNVFDALRRLAEEDVCFDIIFMDAPYNKGLYQKVLEEISICEILSEGGIVVVERNFEDICETLPENIELLREKKYGSTILSFYQKYDCLQEE